MVVIKVSQSTQIHHPLVLKYETVSNATLHVDGASLVQKL